MRQLKVFHHGAIVGTLESPDSYRPPITSAELALIPSFLIARSRSWITEIRDGDIRLELRGEGTAEEVVVVAADRFGVGDVGNLVGFAAADGAELYAPDEEMIALADDVLRQHTGGSR